MDENPTDHSHDAQSAPAPDSQQTTAAVGEIGAKVAATSRINLGILDSKIDVLRSAMSGAIEAGKIHQALADKVAAVAPVVPIIDADLLGPTVNLPDLTSTFDDIDWNDLPQSRSARAAETTVEHLKVLVDHALLTEQRNAELLRITQQAADDAANNAAAADAREINMSRWTKVGVVLAAIAAVAAIVAILMGM